MTGKILAGYLHPGEVTHSFMRSWFAALIATDQAGLLAGETFEECGAGGIAAGRNELARRCLASDAEWLLMVDADMGFDADAWLRLHAAADPDERPIIGGLCFTYQRAATGQHWSTTSTTKPTIYRWVQSDTAAGFEPVYDYPDDAVVRCDGTGGAMLLIHRSVLERLAADWADVTPMEWFDRSIIRGRVFSEDLTFCLRARHAGYPLHVHTGVGTSHRKPSYLMASTVDLSVQTVVAIPTKSRLDMLRPLVLQLVEQGEADEIVVLDNGSNKATRNWLASRTDLTVVDADGWSIHQMWNHAWDVAQRRGQRVNLAILNNDLEIGDKFLSTLGAGLRSDPLCATVCPNYDGRDGVGLEQVDDICAGRYDGTGGLAGFAFMVRAETGYRFPDELRWWCGDNHMIDSIYRAGSFAAICHDTTVEHLDGGSQTGGDWTTGEHADEIAADLAWWRNYLERSA